MKNLDFMSEHRKKLNDRIHACKEKSDKIESNIARIHAEAKTPRPLGIDEVSAAFISALRVTSWETLGDDFGGYKQGRILAYILSVLNEKIEESVSYTINAEEPLYEQCPIIDSKYYGMTMKEAIGSLAEQIRKSADEMIEKIQKEKK